MKLRSHKPYDVAHRVTRNNLASRKDAPSPSDGSKEPSRRRVSSRRSTDTTTSVPPNPEKASPFDLQSLADALPEIESAWSLDSLAAALPELLPLVPIPALAAPSLRPAPSAKSRSSRSKLLMNTLAKLDRSHNIIPKDPVIKILIPPPDHPRRSKAQTPSSPQAAEPTETPSQETESLPVRSGIIDELQNRQIDSIAEFICALEMLSFASKDSKEQELIAGVQTTLQGRLRKLIEGAKEAPPSTEAPSTEAPSTEHPSVEAPSVEAPSSEPPSSEPPSSEPPSLEPPSLEPLSLEPPSTPQRRNGRTPSSMILHGRAPRSKTTARSSLPYARRPPRKNKSVDPLSYLLNFPLPPLDQGQNRETDENDNIIFITGSHIPSPPSLGVVELPPETFERETPSTPHPRSVIPPLRSDKPSLPSSEPEVVHEIILTPPLPPSPLLLEGGVEQPPSEAAPLSCAPCPDPAASLTSFSPPDLVIPPSFSSPPGPDSIAPVAPTSSEATESVSPVPATNGSGMEVDWQQNTTVAASQPSSPPPRTRPVTPFPRKKVLARPSSLRVHQRAAKKITRHRRRVLLERGPGKRVYHGTHDKARCVKHYRRRVFAHVFRSVVASNARRLSIPMPHKFGLICARVVQRLKARRPHPYNIVLVHRPFKSAVAIAEPDIMMEIDEDLPQTHLVLQSQSVWTQPAPAAEVLSWQAPADQESDMEIVVDGLGPSSQLVPQQQEGPEYLPPVSQPTQPEEDDLESYEDFCKSRAADTSFDKVDAFPTASSSQPWWCDMVPTEPNTPVLAASSDLPRDEPDSPKYDYVPEEVDAFLATFGIPPSNPARAASGSSRPAQIPTDTLISL